MRWKDLKLGTKLTIGFGSLIFLVAIVGFITLYQLRSVESKADALTSEFIPLTEVANQIAFAAQRAMYAQRGYR